MEVLAPLGGLHRRAAYQRQPPYTTPDCSNVWPFDTMEERGRIGSRAGLDLAYYELLGSGSPVNLLASVTRIRNDGLAFWTDNFEGTALSTIWGTASWIGTAPGITDDTFAAIAYAGNVGAVRTALSELSTSSPYEVQVFVTPYRSAHWGNFSIFLRMDNTTPAVTTEGVKCTLRMTGTTGAYSGSITEYNASVPGSTAFTPGSDSYAAPGWFTVLVNGNVITCYWRGTQVAQRTVTAHTGKRFGFGIECTEAGGICLVDAFRIQYTSTAVAESRWPMLVAAAGGIVYKETWLGQLVAVTTDLRVATSRPIVAFERAQKLYILDYGDLKKRGADGTIDATGLQLDAASVADWTAIGANANDYVVVLSGSAPAAMDGVYAISAIAAGYVTLATATGSSGTCSYRIERGAKVYDPATDALTLWMATDGDIPVGCQVGCLYRDRAVLASPDNAPHMWYMSKVGDPLNWDYDESESGAKAATYGQSAEAGIIGQPVNATMNHNDDLLVFGCSNSLWVLRGDPMYKGGIDNLSHEIGIVDRQGYARTPDGFLVFLSRDGVYALAPGSGSFPQALSRERLPRELKNLEREHNTVCMGFDLRHYGIHLYVTPADTRQGSHWYFDWTTKSFWPMTLQATHEPYTVLQFLSHDAEFTALLLGSRDGYVSRYDYRWEQDRAGNSVASYCYLGPLKLAPGDVQEGKVTRMDATLDESSGNVTASLYVAETPEKVLTASAYHSATWTAGLNYADRPDVRGYSAAVKVQNGSSARAWALDSLTISGVPRGTRRKL